MGRPNISIFCSIWLKQPYHFLIFEFMLILFTLLIQSKLEDMGFWGFGVLGVSRTQTFATRTTAWSSWWPTTGPSPTSFRWPSWASSSSRAATSRCRAPSPWESSSFSWAVDCLFFFRCLFNFLFSANDFSRFEINWFMSMLFLPQYSSINSLKYLYDSHVILWEETEIYSCEFAKTKRS